MIAHFIELHPYYSLALFACCILGTALLTYIGLVLSLMWAWRGIW